MSSEENRTADHEVEGTGGPMRLPDWPRLMGLSLASAYFGVCQARFRALRIRPVRIGRRVLWDRNDLDRFADDMSGRAPRRGGPASAVKAMERRFYARLEDEKGKDRGQ